MNTERLKSEKLHAREVTTEFVLRDKNENVGRLCTFSCLPFLTFLGMLVRHLESRRPYLLTIVRVVVGPIALSVLTLVILI